MRLRHVTRATYCCLNRDWAGVLVGGRHVGSSAEANSLSDTGYEAEATPVAGVQRGHLPWQAARFQRRPQNSRQAEPWASPRRTRPAAGLRFAIVTVDDINDGYADPRGGRMPRRSRNRGVRLEAASVRETFRRDGNRAHRRSDRASMACLRRVPSEITLEAEGSSF